MKFSDVHTYKVQILGQVMEDDLRTNSPLQIAIVEVDGPHTCITLETDQSGMIGFIRHLHALGLVILGLSWGSEKLPEDRTQRINENEPYGREKT